MKELILQKIREIANESSYANYIDLFEVKTIEEMCLDAQMSKNEFLEVFESQDKQFVCLFSDNPYWLFINEADENSIRIWIKGLPEG